MLLAGLLLLVIALPTGGGSTGGTEEAKTEDTARTAADADSLEAYTRNLEERLSETLSKVQGVGEVSVMITLSSTGEKVVEKDRETSSEQSGDGDSQNSTRSSSSETTVYTGDSQTPYVSRELVPRIEGVAVIAQGGDDPVTVEAITEAVEALFGVEPHKIKVMKSSETK